MTGVRLPHWQGTGKANHFLQMTVDLQIHYLLLVLIQV